MADRVYRRQIQELLAAKTGTEAKDWFLCFKARYGMERVFSTLSKRFGAGKEVVTLPYTCVTAVDPIVWADLIPRYVDIDPDTLNISVKELEKLDVGPVAYVLQHSFGLRTEDEDRRFLELAHQRGAIVVEDSAHCLSYLAKDESGAILADVSVHSFGVEKMLQQSYYGGAIYINPAMQNRELYSELCAALSEMVELDPALEKKAKHYKNSLRAINHAGPLSSFVKSAVGALGLFEPAVSDAERRGILPYAAQALSEDLALAVRPKLRVLADNELHRLEATKHYLEELPRVASHISIPKAALTAAPLLRLPIFFSDEALADKAHAKLQEAGIYSVRWYNVPLLPGALDEDAFHFNMDSYPKDYPHSYSAGQRTLCLPTDVSKDVQDTVISIISNCK